MMALGRRYFFLRWLRALVIDCSQWQTKKGGNRAHELGGKDLTMSLEAVTNST